ncbi:MAG: NAD-dependent epimerase/dehydratase family protein [Acidobacteria bacterium]|nr:NAD-dependent epimerase/dehydratase family protein [Acidobacteriota bacterium]
MKVFLTGATGVLGRPTVQRLVAAGHEVRALARSDKNDELLRQLGAVPVRADLFDHRALERAIPGAEAVLHLATKIPPFKDATKRESWDENNRIRSEGTRLLVDAALAADVRSFIYPSIVFLYPDGGDRWIDADTPIDPVSGLRSAVDAEEEVTRFTRSGGRGVTLRMGVFYSAEAQNIVDTLEAACKGFALMIGAGDAYWSQIWVDDAAEAVVAALLRAPAGVYDVVDDEPLTRDELKHLIARAVGRKRLIAPPTLAVRVVAGKDAMFAARSQRVSNKKFKEATGWSPTMRSAREGWERIMAAIKTG